MTFSEKCSHNSTLQNKKCTKITNGRVFNTRVFSCAPVENEFVTIQRHSLPPSSGIDMSDIKLFVARIQYLLRVHPIPLPNECTHSCTSIGPPDQVIHVTCSSNRHCSILKVHAMTSIQCDLSGWNRHICHTRSLWLTLTVCPHISCHIA
jgi:hypothetical protein